MTQYEEAVAKHGGVYTDIEQRLIDMRVDLCLINLVRDYGEMVKGFDSNAQDTAVTRSLDFMDGYIQDFEGYFEFLKSPEHIKYRYERMARKAQDRAEELATPLSAC